MSSKREEARGMKTVFITGASRGIGRAVAETFSSRGWYVGLYSTNETLLQQLSNEIGQDKSCYKACDVTDGDSVKAAVAHFGEKTGGRMDVLVNNAGVLASGRFEAVDFSEYEKIIDINILGMTTVAYTAFPLLKGTPNSTLVNICSASSIYGIPLLAVYSASKFYVDGLTKALNIEWAHHDIHVTAVKPPVVNTAMAEGLAPQLTKRLTADLQPETVARAIYDAAGGRRVDHILGSKARLWGLANKYLPRGAGKRLVQWLADFGANEDAKVAVPAAE